MPVRPLVLSIAAASAIGVALAGAPVRAAQPAVSARQKPPSGASAPAAAGFPQVTAVRLGGDSLQTRFVMDLSRKVEIATFTLADPYRVVVDLPQVVFKLPPGTGAQGRGLVKAFRYGLMMEGGSRIVLDVSRPVRIDKAFTLAASDGQPARLVLDLTQSDRESFLRSMELQNHAMPRIPVQRSAAAADNDNDPRPLIVLDPGHGGIDSGTKSYNGKVDEKDVVLAFGLELRKVLEKTGKYRVAMTRSDDTFVPLQDRVRFAREHHAALFISIHADSVPRSEGQAEGATVYTLSEHASDAEAAKLADKENKSDVIAGVDLSAQPSDVANILIDLAQRETKTFSVQFARTLVRDFRPTVPLHIKPVKSAGFVVLKSPDVPSVLIELGYMTTPSDLRHLVSPQWRAQTARAVAEAVNDFFARRLVGASVQAK